MEDYSSQPQVARHVSGMPARDSWLVVVHTCLWVLHLPLWSKLKIARRCMQMKTEHLHERKDTKIRLTPTDTKLFLGQLLCQSTSHPTAHCSHLTTPF